MDKNSLVKSIALRNLIHTDNGELIKRYISKRTKPRNLQKSVEEVLSMAGDDGNAKYGALATLNNDLPNGDYGSAAISYIYQNIFVHASTILGTKGYELNIENIVKDLDDIFTDHALQVLNAHEDPLTVPKFVKDIVFVYYTAVLKDKVLNYVLGNGFTNTL